MSFFTAPFSTGSASGGSGSGSNGSNQAFDIPKEELMALCMKLNKKMQSLESKCHDLTRQKTRLLDERQFLADAISQISRVNVLMSHDDAAIEPVLHRETLSKWKVSQIQLIETLESKTVDLERQLQDAKACAAAAQVSSDLLSFDPPSATLPISPVPTTTTSNVSTPLPAIATESVNLTPIRTPASNEQFKVEIENLRRQLQEVQMKNSRSEQDLDRIRNSEAYLKVQVASQEAELKEKTAKMQHYLRDLEDSRGKHEEALMYLQMQLNSFKTKAEISENELKNMTGKATLLQSHADSSTGALKAHEQEINVLKKQISDHELKYTKLREHTTEVEKNMNMMNLMKAEQDNLYNTFKREAKVAVDAKEELLGKVKELQVENSRLAIEGSEKSEMQQLVTSLKQQIQEQEAQSARWRQEALQNERSHAMKTAMLATAEVHIENLKKELAVKDDTTKEALERVSLLQVRLASAESRLEERILELNAKLDDSKKQEDDLVKRHEVDIASVKEKYDLQIEGIHRDNAKKSSTARILLSEKEEETRVMRERIRDLETEISSGAPSERRIFELASMQAKRDAVHGVQNENREMALQQMQHILETKDMELARFNQIQTQLTAEVGELRRVARREGVNMDYLKNIVLQYMVFPVASDERQQLAPVLATLLQFNPKEVAEVEKSAQEAAWLISNPRQVIEIKRSLKNASRSIGSHEEDSVFTAPRLR